MGFVRTAEEVKRICHVLKQPRFVGSEMLSVDFLAEPRIRSARCSHLDLK